MWWSLLAAAATIALVVIVVTMLVIHLWSLWHHRQMRSWTADQRLSYYMQYFMPFLITQSSAASSAAAAQQSTAPAASPARPSAERKRTGRQQRQSGGAQPALEAVAGPLSTRRAAEVRVALLEASFMLDDLARHPDKREAARRRGPVAMDLPYDGYRVEDLASAEWPEREDEHGDFGIIWVHGSFAGVFQNCETANDWLCGHAYGSRGAMLRTIMLQFRLPVVGFRMPSENVSTLNFGQGDDIAVLDDILRRVLARYPTKRFVVYSECIGAMKMHRWYQSRVLDRAARAAYGAGTDWRRITAIVLESPILEMQADLLRGVIPRLVYEPTRRFFDHVLPNFSMEADRDWASLTKPEHYARYRPPALPDCTGKTPDAADPKKDEEEEEEAVGETPGLPSIFVASSPKDNLCRRATFSRVVDFYRQTGHAVTEVWLPRGGHGRIYLDAEYARLLAVFIGEAAARAAVAPYQPTLPVEGEPLAASAKKAS